MTHSAQPTRRWMRLLLLAAATVLLVVVGLGAYVYVAYVANETATRYEGGAERFKYQSIGTEAGAMPLYVWEALPAVCSDTMPEGGYASFGFVFEPGRDRPVGLTDRTMGVPRAGLNCATCHTGTARTSPEAEPMVLVGAPAHQLDLQRYARFMIACVTSPSYTADRVMAEIEARHDLGPIERLVYRHLVIPGTHEEILQLESRLAWSNRRPPFGPGRVDSFNPVKYDFNVDLSQDDSIGTSDFPSAWNLGAREGFYLHWDGSNTSFTARNIAATVASGATPDSVDLEELAWTEEYLKTLAPPPYPFPVDDDLAAAGEPIFREYCARCHAPEGAQVGRTTAIEEIGTDRERYDVFTQELADQFMAIGEGYTWKFKGYQRNTGYLNVLLDGVWARAPYLHNGSVPTLRDLLEPPANRTPVFYRGYDVYDPVNVGFVTEGPEAERVGVRHDTAQPGNGNGGHLYGTDLSAEQKAALIEFLKRQ